MEKVLFTLLLLCSFVSVQAGIKTWNGSQSVSWNNPYNWTPYGIPSASDDVIIPYMEDIWLGPSTYDPTLNYGNAHVNSVEVKPQGNLTINAPAQLTINGFRVVSGNKTSFYTYGTVRNYGKIIIGNLNIIGDYGLYNRGTFYNYNTGEINIDNSTSTVVYNSQGTFTNNGKITIGANSAVGDNGILNKATFNNNTGGDISIESSGNVGLLNQTGSFTNAAKITIGSNLSVGAIGIFNDALFNNLTGGNINIDNTTSFSLINQNGEFTNAATITIGEIGYGGLWNKSIFNNNGCGKILLKRGKLWVSAGQTYTNTGFTHVIEELENEGTFTNNGVLKYSSTTGNPVINITDSSIVVNDTLSTIFGYGGTFNGTVNGIFKDETATVSAGSYEKDRDSDFEADCNLPGGTQTLYASITPSSCTSPVLVPFLYNNVVATPTELLTWTGAASTAWNDACNWSPTGIPTATNDVVIPAGPANQPTLSINTAVASSVEVQSGATFTIATDGKLELNGSKEYPGEFPSTFYNNGTIDNNGEIVIGNSNSVGDIGLLNRSTFNNNAGGKINIDRTSFIALRNHLGVFTNEALISIGSNTSIGLLGIRNESIFYNNLGGEINIDRPSSGGIHNYQDFDNNAQITIGAQSTVGYSGITNYSTFNNNVGGEINIDNSSRYGLGNQGSFTNRAIVNIGANAQVGEVGLVNFSTFENKAGGEISIDNSTFRDLNNSGGEFKNEAKITIGAFGAAGSGGLGNRFTFNNTSCAEIKILKGNFVNYALSGTDGIVSNAGYIFIADSLINDVTFTNDGLLKSGVQTGNPVVNSTSSSIIVNNTLSTIFSYGGTYNGTVNGIFTDEAATVSAGSFSEPIGFVPSSILPLGNQTFYAKVTPNGGACSHVVPFLFDNFREIDVRGNYLSIANGDMSPSVSDLTDFGVAGITGGTISNIFTIVNEGTSTLTLGANPVTKSGPHEADFTIVQPSGTTIAPGDSVYLEIIFDPSVLGERNATISIANDDANESPYTFAILGNSICNTSPTASIIGSDNLSCAITSVTRTASGGNSYSWSNGDITEQATISTAGTYTVTVTAANGCSSTASTEVTIDNTPPIASISDSQNLSCNITSVTRTASAGISYSWSNGLGTNATANINSEGTYTVIVTAANGCTSTATTEVTIDNTSPTASISGSQNLSCNITSVTRTASGGISYSWSNGLGTNAAANISTAGTYTVTVIAANGCTSTATTEVTIDNTSPISSISGSQNLSCAITSVTRTASGGTSYVWSNGLGTNATANIRTAGTYTVTVTAANGCTSTTTTEVTIDNTPPTASITDSQNLSCNITSVTRTASGGTSYSWSNGLGTNATANINSAGTYTVTVTAANGCTSTATTEVTIDNTPPMASITGTDSLNCTQNTVTRTALGGQSYVWSNGIGTSPTVSLTNTGTYTVTVTAANGCISTATTEVVFDNNLVVTASNDGPYEEQETINLMTTGGPSYSWIGPDRFTSSLVNPSISNASPAKAGIYTVTVTNGSCTGTATTDVIINCSTPGMSYYLAYVDSSEVEVFSPLVSEMEVQVSNKRMTVLAIPNCELPIIESARLQLSGTGNTQFYVDNVAPYSLYENNGATYGDVFEANYYTFIARGYAHDNSQGVVVGPDVIRFWVVSGDRELTNPTLSTTVICAGASLSVSSTTTGASSFNVGNMYQVFLSDENGSFGNQILIGSSSNPNNIACTIPGNLTEGSNYKVIVRSSSPIVSSDASTSLSITASNLSLLSPKDDILNGTQTEKAIQTINAVNKITGSSTVMYKAGNAILLAPGFSVTSGNVFSARIEDVCIE